MRGNGPYKGRYYYNWIVNKDMKVKPPKMGAKMKGGSLILEWPGQVKAEGYEIEWSTNACEVVQVVKT